MMDREKTLMRVAVLSITVGSMALSYIYKEENSHESKNITRIQ